jgi:multidrug transporter EmrE-like cation transporter
MLYKVVLGLGVLFNVAAQVLLRSTMRGYEVFGGDGALAARIVAILRKPFFWLSLMCYGVGFLMYTVALSKLELSKAYPVSSVAAIVIIATISILFLKETVDIRKAAGLALCVAGIFLILR